MGLLSSLGGALFDFASADYTREKNEDFARDSQRVTQEFQERMRGTQYQTAVADMKAAGLNPMLAYMHGGAGTPPGGSATSTGSRPSTPSDAFYKGALSEQSAAQVDLMKSQEKNVDADTQVKNAQRDEILARTPTHGVQVDKMRQEIKESEERVRNLVAETSRSYASADHYRQQVENLRATLPHIEASIKHMESFVRLNDAQVKELASRVGKQEAEVREIIQRVRADLPKLQRDLGELSKIEKNLDMPRREQDSRVHDGFVGTLGSVLRTLNPLNNFLGR